MISTQGKVRSESDLLIIIPDEKLHFDVQILNAMKGTTIVKRATISLPDYCNLS